MLRDPTTERPSLPGVAAGLLELSREHSHVWGHGKGSLPFHRLIENSEPKSFPSQDCVRGKADVVKSNFADRGRTQSLCLHRGPLNYPLMVGVNKKRARSAHRAPRSRPRKADNQISDGPIGRVGLGTANAPATVFRMLGTS